MDNYQDQARAIWNALDKMLEQDPEGYQRFVADQLQQGRSVLKKQSSTSGSTQSPPSQLEQAFEKLSLGVGRGSSQDREPPQNVGFKRTVKTESSATTDQTAESGCNLLDDKIGGKKSILERIVKDFDSGCGNENDEDDVKIDLAIDPTKKNPGQVNKPLIEEI